MMELVVIKKNAMGHETYRYKGRLLEQLPDRIVLEAYFDRDDMDLHGLRLARGDRFLETWYLDRWYNIFEIHALEDDAIRGWYCNVGRPAEIDGQSVSYVDLCLDLLVFPDGRQIVLDEDEFNALEISPLTRQQALQALAQLQSQFG